ncbi:MAG: hypothetical protein Q4F72_12835, partial [Desulfovibrionaceae bacterium]|nr:hypothetical protein [Desulfovibrionaceae bacterium]
CPAYDYRKMVWRHRNLNSLICEITAWAPRTKCPEHGVHRCPVPWARKGSSLTLAMEDEIMRMLETRLAEHVARALDLNNMRIGRLARYRRAAGADNAAGSDRETGPAGSGKA